MELSKFGDIKNLILHLFPPEEHPENYDAASLWNLVIEAEAYALKSLSIEKERDELVQELHASERMHRDDAEKALTEISELKAERDRYMKLLQEIPKEVAKKLSSFHIDANELCDVMQNICQLLLGIKPDGVDEKWWSDWDESVLQSAIDTLRKVQPYYVIEPAHPLNK